MAELLFIKLGGSLITDKSRPFTARTEILQDLTAQIAESLELQPDLNLVLGHGSGSFGHTAADKYQTREGLSQVGGIRGAHDRAYWQGFTEVGYQAARLNDIFMESLHSAGVMALSFPPSAMVITRNRQVRSWDLAGLLTSLNHRMVPVIYGDVIFDEILGGTILSTEELFEHLALRLKPDRILLAGQEPGVWEDYPSKTRILNRITTESIEILGANLHGSENRDVTGGMLSKVRQMTALCRQLPDLTVQIFSGLEKKALSRTINGEILGTLVLNERNDKDMT